MLENHLRRLLDEHQHALVKGFSEYHNLKKLYSETTPGIDDAIQREK